MDRKRQLILAGGFFGKPKHILYKCLIKDIRFYKRIEDIPYEYGYRFVVIPYSGCFDIICFDIKSFRRISLKSFKKPSFKLLEIKPSYEEYMQKVVKLKEHIERGDIYQANLAMRFTFDSNLSALNIFKAFYAFQPVSFGFFLQTGDFFMISGSMELFISKAKNKLISKPIKGTSKKFLTLKKSQKDKSENLMITDVMRDDFNRICDRTSVKVERLFKITKHKSLYHMHSVISGKSNLSFKEIIPMTIPVASISGAPKIKATEIISALEPFDRGYYCGVAMLLKGKDFVSSVLIRTMYGDSDKFYYFAGSGITYESNPEKELRENLLKSRFFMDIS